MAINFRKIASQELSLSELMTGRVQITTDELIGKKATIVAFDLATITDKGEEKVFPVLLLKEYPDRYYNGGTLLMKMCTAWAAEYGGDIATASIDLEKAGGVEVEFKSTKTKDGKNLTSIIVL